MHGNASDSDTDVYQQREDKVTLFIGIFSAKTDSACVALKEENSNSALDIVLQEEVKNHS